MDLDCFGTLLDELQRLDAVLPPHSLVEWAAGRLRLDRPRVVLSFDDGYADVLEIAAPELSTRGLRALLCVTTAVASGAQRGFPVDPWYAAVTGATVRAGLLNGIAGEPWSFDLDIAANRARLIDGPEKRAFVRAAPEQQRAFLDRLRLALGAPAAAELPATLDAGGLRTLADTGWMLGSHGERHALLPLLSERDAAEDLTRSRAFFAEIGLPPPDVIAYPDGATCPRTEALAEAAGYTVGLALGGRAATPDDPPLRLPRLIPTDDPTWFERRLRPLLTGAAAR